MARSSCHNVALLATKAQGSTPSPPSATFATSAQRVAGCHHPKKHIDTRRFVIKISIDYKLVDSVFGPMHARFSFASEGCTDDEGYNSQSDLAHCSLSDSILERDLTG
jgi:hypothetical protein